MKRRTTGERDTKVRGRGARGRARRLVNVLAGSLMGVYLLLLCFPQIVFAHSLAYRHFRVYSTGPLDPNIRPVLDRADRLLTRSEINSPQTVHRLFLCPSHGVYAFFAPAARTAFADNQPFLHNIFLNTADAGRDIISSGASAHGRRTLSGVIAHECTHTLLAARFGQVAMLWQPSWKQEGYCDWVAASTSFDPAAGERLLAQGRSDPSASFSYFRAYTAVRYLEEKRHWDVARIMGTPLSLDDTVRAGR